MMQYFWIRRARAAMRLLERYDNTDEIPRLLIEGTYNIFADHPDGLIALYLVLLDEYPNFLKYFMSAEVDPEEADDSGPHALERGSTQPVSLAQRMRESGYHLTEEMYQ